MHTLKLALLSAAVAGLSLTAASANAAAERHYDCTKAGNANKAECKAAATKPAMTPAPMAKPAPVAMAKPAPTPSTMATAKPPRAAKPPKAAPGTRSPAQLANDNKMKACGAKWDALGAGDKAKWTAKGQARKDKNGHPETGWITFSSDCRKSA